MKAGECCERPQLEQPSNCAQELFCAECVLCKRMEGLKKLGVTALNGTAALREDLKIELKIVTNDTGTCAMFVAGHGKLSGRETSLA